MSVLLENPDKGVARVKASARHVANLALGQQHDRHRGSDRDPVNLD
jgi:hypothetical protein